MNLTLRSILAPILVGLLLVILACAAAGCGKKGWPEPQKSEDRFGFEDVHGSIADGCLSASMRVVGASRMLDGLIILLEQPDPDCGDCPFVPEQRVDLALSDRQVQVGPDSVSLTWCGLEPGVRYRFRVLGVNRLRSMPLVPTRVLP